MSNIHTIARALWHCLPRRVYFALCAVYASACNCWTLLFRMGFFRSCLAGGSVDAHGQSRPWYTYPAIEFIKGLNLSDKDVFEYGSGHSTAYYSKHTRSVVAVEDNVEWGSKVRGMVGANATVIYAGNETDYVNAINHRESYDIIVIDGTWRGLCAKAAIAKLRPGGMIIMDNSDEARLTLAAANVLDDSGLLRVDFYGFSPCIYWPNVTAIYFDRRTA